MAGRPASNGWRQGQCPGVGEFSVAIVFAETNAELRDQTGLDWAFSSEHGYQRPIALLGRGS